MGDFIDHVDHAVDLIGIDHVGLSSDFDGGGGIVDWFDAGETFNVTLELVRRGWATAETTSRSCGAAICCESGARSRRSPPSPASDRV